jgi:preprotein translocase subunit SecY
VTQELAKRIGFTLGALLVYRLGSFVPLPGLEPQILLQQLSGAGSFFGMSLFFGGGTARLSIFALTLVPYISAAILMQIAVLLSRRLRALTESGERGRGKIEIATLVLTAVLALFQAVGIANALTTIPGLVTISRGAFLMTASVSLAGGALFLAWFAGRITARGIGNGVAMILFAGIVADAPQVVATVSETVRMGYLSGGRLLLVLAFAIGLTAIVVTVELARRHFVVLRADGKGASMVSIKLNPAGIMSHGLALWLMLIPLGVQLLWEFVNPAQGVTIAQALHPTKPLYLGLLVLFVLIASLVYTAFLWDPQRIAERLETYGLRLHEAASGEPTAAVLDQTLSRLAIFGALYLALGALGPEILFVHILGLPFVYGGFALFVVVATVLDVKTQVEASIEFGGERR